MRGVPPELDRLLDAGAPSDVDDAWSAFLQRYSALILKTARSLSADYDGAMDRYRYALEQLRRDDFRRLRGYDEDPRAGFPSWLIVVVNRLCLDYQRQRYGRVKGDREGPAVRHRRLVRRRLKDLDVEALDAGVAAVARGPDPETRLRQQELSDTLEIALAEADPRDRLLLRLRFEDGLSVRQITDMMGYRSVFQVYRRLKGLTMRLRASLEDRGIADPFP